MFQLCLYAWGRLGIESQARSVSFEVALFAVSYAEGVQQYSPGQVIRAKRELRRPGLGCQIQIGRESAHQGTASLPRPKQRAAGCGLGNAAIFRQNARLDRRYLLSFDPGWRRATASLGLPWAILFHAFGVCIRQKRATSKSVSEGRASLTLRTYETHYF